MSVEFNEPQYDIPSPIYKNDQVGIAGTLIKLGIAKDKKQANVVMIGIIAIMSIIFFLAVSSLGGNRSTEVLPPEITDTPAP